MTHPLKTYPEYFQAVYRGEKPFEVRLNDRNFSVGDLLTLQEFDPATQTYTGNQCERFVSYILPGGNFGIEPEYCVLGLAL